MRSFLALLASMLLAGCGGASDAPPTYSVSGLVTYDGTPVEGATVTFDPQSQEQRAAFGLTNAEGYYQLTTSAGADGAMAGTYTVTIEKILQAAPTSAQGVDESSPDYEPPPDDPLPQAKPATKHLLPAKYAETATSGLTANVEEGSNEFDFPLTN